MYEFIVVVQIMKNKIDFELKLIFYKFGFINNSMIRTDRSIVKLNLYHPSSSLVITNPNPTLAVIFQISTEDMKSQNKSHSSVPFQVSQLIITPLRGIILPSDSQLIKISQQIDQNNKKRVSNIQRNSSLLQYELGKLNIVCSYFLEYNKQKIIQSNSKNRHGLFGLKDLQKVETYSFKIFAQIESSRNTDFHSNHDNLTRKNNSQNQAGIRLQTRRNSLVDTFKKTIEPINVNTLTSSNYIKDFKEKQVINFQNSKLNFDYDFVRNKVTLNDIQKRKSNEMLKQLQEVNGKNHSKGQYKTLKQTSSIETPPYLKKNQTVEQSFVVQNYKPKYVNSKKQINPNINNQSIQIIFLAIFAAIFVSLGSNFRHIFDN